MRFPWTRWCTALVTAALAACSRDQPLAPQLHSISGHLRLTGYLVDADGQYAGTRVLGDPDGVPVELLHGTEVVARTTTVGGVYHFSGLRPGDYAARSRVIGDIGDQTNHMVIAVSDVMAADTLRLFSRGDLLPLPNPFVDTIQVYFAVPSPTWVEVNILDVGGNAVKNLLALDVPPGRHAVFWNGRDQKGRPVPGSLFWVTYVAGRDVRAALLFRQEGSPRPTRRASEDPAHQGGDATGGEGAIARERLVSPRPPRASARRAAAWLPGTRHCGGSLARSAGYGP